MAYTTFDRYLEAEVLDADPVKLVNLLYRGALEAVAAARGHVAGGRIGPRSGQIMKAWDILHELTQSLDRARGGELARNLAALYAYAQQRLLDANAQQSDAPLAEVEKLLGTLAQAWREVAPALAQCGGDLPSAPGPWAGA
jgi:flagellar protein FliS